MDEDVIGIIALSKEKCEVDIIMRDDLTSSTFPSIWLEIKDLVNQYFKIYHAYISVVSIEFSPL